MPMKKKSQKARHSKATVRPPLALLDRVRAIAEHNDRPLRAEVERRLRESLHRTEQDEMG